MSEDDGNRDELTIYEIKTSDTIDLIVYEGDFNILHADEKDIEKLCRSLKIKPEDNTIIERINSEMNRENIDHDIMFIDETNKEIEFYLCSGGSLIVNYSELTEPDESNYIRGKLISAKNKWIEDENKKQWKEIKKLKQGIHEIDTWLCNELTNTDRKIEFCEKNNDVINLSKNAGKVEMAAKILEKLRNLRGS